MKRLRLAAALAILALAVPATAADAPKPASLAKCLGERGMVFFGASWCPYCAEQKRLFGADAANLPYVECSADGNRWGKRTPACIAAGVDSYPSWRFPDGIPRVGVRSLEELARISGCPGGALLAPTSPA